MSSINRLKREQNYLYKSGSGSSCNNCMYFLREEAYEGIEGMSAKMCMYYRDTELQEPVLLVKEGGICDRHRR